MGSRRLTRSYSGDGRSGSYNGDDVTGSSRATGLSYLSGVRPENRSTLCTVMAHLAEETQPSFEATLKSRAVSEACNVKFTCVVSGNPAPEITWYKDDIQLDRYCGLPKYEVSRNGQNHSLHIFNCTLEDAAIYQASARNSKGIVSCSGVLEVGTMSEYKIHQQYFAKLKQKAENKRKELEDSRSWDKENRGPGRQEQLRTISPDRSQRKRRSPMEASLSTPSSIEDEGTEENVLAPAAESEARLQMAALEGTEKPVPVINGPVSPTSEGQDVKVNVSNGHTYMYDSVQKIFTAQPPKTPFAKKKIKISNGVGDANSDSLVEVVSEDRRTSKETVDEAMEVENSAPDHVEEKQQAVTFSPSNFNVSVLQEQIQGKLHTPSPKEKPLDFSSAAPSSVKETLGERSGNGVEQEKALEVEPKEPKLDLKDILINQCTNSPIISSQPKSSSLATPPLDLHNLEVGIQLFPDNVSAMEVDMRPSALEPIPKPSALIPVQKPSVLEQNPATLEPTHKPSALDPTHKPSAVEPTHKPTALEPTHKPSALEPTHKPSSLEPVHKPSALEPTHKPTALEPTHKPSALEPTHKPSAVEPTHKPTALEPTHKPSALEPTHKPSALEPTHKPSALKPVHKPSALEPILKPSALELVHHPSSLEPVHKSSELEPVHKPSSLEPMHKPSSLEPPLKPLALEPVHPPSSLEPVHKPSSLEPIHKPTALKPAQSTVGNKSKVTVEDTATIGVEVLSSDTSINGTTVAMDSESIAMPCDSENGFPQRPCEQSGDQLSGKETSSSPKNVSAFLPPRQDEVTQAHTQTKRNDAPVDLQPQTTRSELDVRLQQRTPSGREVTADANKTPSLHNAGQFASDAMSKSTWVHSRGSNESHSVPITDVLKSPLESPGNGENTSGCNISPTLKPGRVEIAIKTGGGTEIQVEKKVQSTDGQRVQKDNFSSVKKKVDNEAEGEMVRTINEPEKEHGVSNVMDVAEVEMEKNVAVLKKEESPVIPKPVSPCLSPETVPDSSQIADTNTSTQQTKDIKDLPKPVANMSVADLLRAQMKAMISSMSPILPNPVPYFNSEHQLSLLQSTTVQDARQSPEINMDGIEYNKEMGNAKMEKETDTNICSVSEVMAGQAIVQHSGNTKPVLMQSTSLVNPRVEALPTLGTLPIPNKDQENIFETRNHHIVKDNDSIMDTGQESGDLQQVALEHNANVYLTVPDKFQINSISVTPNHKSSSGVAKISVPLVKIFQENKQVQGNTIQEMDSSLSVLLKVSSQHHQVSSHPAISLLPCKAENHSYSKRPECLINMTQKVQLVGGKTPDTPILLDQPEEHKQVMPQSNSQIMQRLDMHVPELGTNTQELPVPCIDLASSTIKDIKVEDYSKMDSLTPISNPKENSLLRKGESISPIPSATPQELASGARRKIFVPKTKGEDTEATPAPDSQPPIEEVQKRSNQMPPETPSVSPSSSRRSPLLQPKGGQATPPSERRSPLLSRRKVAPETPKQMQEPAQTDPTKTEKPAEKDKHNAFKAPQVIRKIRGEASSDASGHLKLWCQFFNVLSDSTIKWYRDEVEIAEIKRSAGDETQVALAIVQASSRDCGVYGCTIINDYGTDSTDYLLSVEILAGMFLREDLQVGEEIEMTPLLFNKGLADAGQWGSKFFGRIMITENHIGEGCPHKTSRAKVIYGLEPVFESGTTCIIKVRSPIAYGAKEEGNLIERNLQITQLECRIHNIAREYCKIFAAETRVIENFGPALEVIPLYLMYRPANTVPHATVEADLKGLYLKYCLLDASGTLIMRTCSEVEQKCCALQHWVYQWTNGNLLLTRLEGVDTKITNVEISIQSKGYQGLSAMGNPRVFEQFVTQHQCNYYCSLLSLRALKTMDSLQTPVKSKGPRSPMLNRKMPPGSSSPQTPRKGTASPRVSRKSESEDTRANIKHKAVETSKVAR